MLTHPINFSQFPRWADWWMSLWDVLPRRRQLLSSWFIGLSAVSPQKPRSHAAFLPLWSDFLIMCIVRTVIYCTALLIAVAAYWGLLWICCKLLPCVPKKVSPLTFCNNNRKSAPIWIKFYTHKTTSVTNVYTVSYKSALTLLKYEFLNNITHKSWVSIAVDVSQNSQNVNSIKRPVSSRKFSH